MWWSVLSWRFQRLWRLLSLIPPTFSGASYRGLPELSTSFLPPMETSGLWMIPVLQSGSSLQSINWHGHMATLLFLHSQRWLLFQSNVTWSLKTLLLICCPLF
jgi:hypothetical protein